MDWLLVTYQGVDVTYRRPDAVSRWEPAVGAAVGASQLRENQRLMHRKLQANPLLLEHLHPLVQLIVSRSASRLSTNSLYSLLFFL
jgi:hypothetical protein